MAAMKLKLYRNATLKRLTQQQNQLEQLLKQLSRAIEAAPYDPNDAFAKLLNGLAIGQLRQPDQAQPLRRSEADLTHPLFQPLLREEWGNLQEIHFSRYQTVQSQGKAEIALRAAGGEPGPVPAGS